MKRKTKSSTLKGNSRPRKNSTIKPSLIRMIKHEKSKTSNDKFNSVKRKSRRTTISSHISKNNSTNAPSASGPLTTLLPTKGPLRPLRATSVPTVITWRQTCRWTTLPLRGSSSRPLGTATMRRSGRRHHEKRLKSRGTFLRMRRGKGRNRQCWTAGWTSRKTPRTTSRREALSSQ